MKRSLVCVDKIVRFLTVLQIALFYRLRAPLISRLIFLNNVLFMYDFHRDKVTSVFEGFFKSVNKTYRYNTRLASKNIIVLA